MSRYEIEWPMGEVEGPPLPGSAEASLAFECADWGPLARAELPELRLLEACPTRPSRFRRPF